MLEPGLLLALAPKGLVVPFFCSSSQACQAFMSFSQNTNSFLSDSFCLTGVHIR